MIELDRITVSLPPNRSDAKTILKHISFSIGAGEWVALTGPNGSGKSTLLKTLAGLYPLQEGTIRFGGGPAGDVPRMALLLQEPDNQFVASSVANELELSPPPGLDAAERALRIEEAVGRFGLERFLDRNPHRLSGGEKQRLALATVWLAAPAVLLLDEPTSYLDDDERNRCVEFVGMMKNDGVAVVWATPGGDDLLDADRVVCLDGGAVCHDGPAGTIEEWIKKSDLDIIPPGDGPMFQGAPEGLDKTGSGGAVPRMDESARDDADVLISLRDVAFAYGEGDVLCGVNTDILAGEVVGIAGKNGSGKSTLLSLIGGVLEPTGGLINRKFRSPVVRNGSTGKSEQAVFYLFQSPERLFFAETVDEEIGFGLKSLGTDEKETASVVAESLSRVGLDPDRFLSRSPFGLSLGEMRRVAFAIAYALRPKLLLLDEPSSCLDRGGLGVLAGLIDDLSAGGSAIVVASHDTRVLRKMTGRILAIENSRLAR